jgi:hypothetical protein
VPKPPPVAPKVQVLTAKRTVEAPRASADLRQSEIDALLNW